MWQLDSTSWTSILVQMVFFAATSARDIADEFATSLLEIEKIAKCWSRLCVDDSQRRYIKRTSFSLIAVLSGILPAVALRNHWGVHPTTLSKILNHHKFPGLLMELIERVMRFADKDPKTRILIGFICSKARHRSVACSYLMQVIHTALNYTVNTRTTAIASSGRHLCNRDTCPDCSHLSVAAVRLMESVRERLVASWNKAVASAVSTSQHPKQSVTLTSMPATPVTPAIGKSWRITEKAPPPQPSKRASFFKGTLEQARLAGLTDEEVASIADALKPVLEEKYGDSGRSVKRGVLPETCSLQTIKRGKAVLEPSSNPERLTSLKQDEYNAHDQWKQAGSTSTSAAVTVPSTKSSTGSYYADGGHDNENTKTSCSSTCNPVLVYWTASANSRSGRNAACANAQDKIFRPFQRRHGHC